MDLIDSLIREGWLKTPEIIEAFRKIKRADFLLASPTRLAGALAKRAGGPEDLKDLAELNEALAIGHGQTISQPLVVAFMLELLQLQPGDRILDIGSGSGWTTALLAEIVKDKGKVMAIEIIPELKEFGENNAAKYGFVKKGTAEFVCGDGTKGYSKEAPFDKILVSAASNAAGASAQEKIPEAWKEQLKIGGRIVTPIGNSIWLFLKKSEDEFEETEYPGFVFVPLVSK